MANNGILFLTLRVFSATGGIEKVCKVVCMALNELSAGGGSEKFKVFSMYDESNDADKKYVSPNLFQGFNKLKLSFACKSLMQGLKSDIVVLSHINLLSIGYVIKLLSPKTKLVLFAHGIEVWGPLSAPRKKMLGKCNKILAVSHFTKDRLLQECRLPEQKVAVLNNCLDPYLPPYIQKGKDAVLQKKYQFSKNSIVLMTLTRLSSKELYKGYDNVLVALSQLKDKYPSLKYLIVGRYDAGEKQRLDNIIQQHALQQQVVFTGYIPDEELANHYHLADIYVMPSKKEGFGIVFIEAMHYGLPVIAGNKDGSADALCNGKLGILIDPDNQEEINRAIEEIILHRQQHRPDQNLLAALFSYAAYKNNLRTIIDTL
jgi:glycosyltransferase involved in cell wall biosynthesis